MPKHLDAICLVVMISVTGVASAQVSRDHLVVGERHYIRSQRPNNELPYGIEYHVSLSATNSGCSQVLDHRDSFSIRYAVLSDWSPYGELRSEVILHEVEGIDLRRPSCLRTQDTVYAMWWNFDLRGKLRLFDFAGSGITDPIVVCEDVQVDGRYFAEATIAGDEVWIQVNPEGPGGNTQLDIYFRAYDLDGNARSELIPVTTATATEEGSRPTTQADGSVIVPYGVGRRFYYQYPAIRRIDPDRTVGDEILLSQDYRKVETIFAKGLADGELIVGWRQTVDSIESYAYLQRLNAYGQPLAAPVPIDYQAWNWAANVNGDIVVGIYDPILADELHIRLYDRFGNPRSERFDPSLDPPFEHRNFLSSTPIAITDDGTIYASWWGDDSHGGGHGSFMTVLHPFLPGDMNRDGLLNNFDIDPFVFALSNLPAYAESYDIPEDAAVIIGDINEDGFLNNFDIDPFVMLLAGE